LEYWNGYWGETMYDLATIQSMNEEVGQQAEEKELTPYVVQSKEELDTMPPFPFPNFGNFRPHDWKLVERYFVDSSGLGAPDELALTAYQFKEKLKVGRGYAIIEEGQFQVYAGEFIRKCAGSSPSRKKVKC
jgi:hypothetical protein